MRLLLFLAIWVMGFTQSLIAQNLAMDSPGNLLAEMTAYVDAHLGEEFPGEVQTIKGLMRDYKSQGELTLTFQEIQQLARKSYWEKLFLQENRERVLEAKRLNSRSGGVARNGSPLPNPDLVVSCNLNIAIVIDQSGSITSDAVEVANIRAGLNAFVANQVGTGNTVSLIGMGSLGDNGPGAAPDGPSTVVYDASTTNANVHTNWINNTLFQNTSANSDSWSTGLAVAAGLPADLVIIIADGATGGNADIAGICAAGNTLKSNGQNGGNGAHLFVFCESPGAFVSSSLPNYLTGGITTNNPPLEATNPPTTLGISTSDFIGVPNNDDFFTLSGWLGSVIPGGGMVTTTSIWPRTCILNNFAISGTYSVCSPITATSLVLRFFNTNGQVVTVPATLNGDGTWTFSSSLTTMVGLGLSFGTWYDVVPILTLSDGTVVTGQEFILGTNDDLYFADQSNPVVTLNTSPTDANPSQTQFCEGDPIYYHGVDPLSSNHFSAIRKRPIGSPDPFADYADVGWLNASLDGFNDDLIAQYPGYFNAGWEYQLYIASHNGDPEVCIAWTPVTVVFEVIDCCQPNFTFETPECVEDGVPFVVSVSLDVPLSPDQIELIYSNYPNFTYLSHTAVQTSESLELDITFVSNSCTCEGEQLVFDIIVKGCSETIWIMTDRLPCCASECGKTEVVNWRAEDCILVNGKPARPFCLEVSTQGSIQDVVAGSNNATCQVELEALQITNVSSTGIYTICGLMVFQDPTCTGHAIVSLILDTGESCCTIERPFSFPGGCVIEEECNSTHPDIQIIYGSNVHVSLDIPTGSPLTVIDHMYGGTTTTTVGTVTCGPFNIDQDGNVLGGNDCNGIILTSPTGLNCQVSEGNLNPSFLYHFEIHWGECVWVLTGDYCDEIIVYHSLPGGGNNKRSARVESVSSTNTDQVKVFPNPVAASDILNFDLSALSTGVKEIRLTDVYGKTIEVIIPDADAQVFQHRMERPLQDGLYFIVCLLNDGTVSSSRLVATE